MEQTASVRWNDCFSIRLNSVPTDLPLPYDAFLVVNDKLVLFRKKGDEISQKRLDQLSQKDVKEFLVPSDQLEHYKKSFNSIIRNEKAPLELRGRIAKEGGLIQAKDLFTKSQVAPVVEDTKEYLDSVFALVSKSPMAIRFLSQASTHDIYTYNHAVDVAIHSMALTQKIYGEDKEKVLLAGIGGILHDIGERGIDWGIISKSEKLTRAEVEELKRHTVYGQDYLKSEDAIPKEALEAVLHHHENYDGSGYPDGQKGDEIYWLAQLVSITDVYDALISHRSYRTAMSSDEALKLMKSMQPGRFAPDFFDAFTELMTEILKQSQ